MQRTLPEESCASSSPSSATSDIWMSSLDGMSMTKSTNFGASAREVPDNGLAPPPLAAASATDSRLAHRRRITEVIECMGLILLSRSSSSSIL